MNTYNDLLDRLSTRRDTQHQAITELETYIDKIRKLNNLANGPLIRKLEAQLGRLTDNLRTTVLEIKALEQLTKTK